MAFTTKAITLLKLGANIDRSPLYDELTSALAAGAAANSVTALGGLPVVARAVAGAIDAYRVDPVTGPLLSAGASITVGMTATSSLLTLQLQIIPAV